jgi:hypothetical protein
MLLLLVPVLAFAEMASIDDSELAEVTGQSGVYLTGEVSFNEEGGPLEDSYFGLCTDANKVCGARIAVQTEENGGWFVLDDIRGSISFEGLTVQLKTISDGFGGDGALFNKDVIEIGLPESVRMNDFQFTLATGNLDRPSDAGYKQVDFATVEMSGDITLQGNLLVFPTD